MDEQHEGDKILHQDSVEDVVREVLSDSGASGALQWYGPYVVWANLLQTISTLGGPPDAGTFKLAYDGVDTVDLDWNASLGDIEAALDAIPALTGKVTCVGYNSSNNPLSPINTATDLTANKVGVSIINTPARPLALTVSENLLTAGGDPVADPVIASLATKRAFARLRAFTAGEIFDDAFAHLIEAFADGTAGASFTSVHTTSLWHPPELNDIPLFGDTLDPDDDFSSNSSAQGSSSIITIDSAQSYGDVPSVALVNADLYLKVNSRADDSAGVAHIYLRVGTPIAP